MSRKLTCLEKRTRNSVVKVETSEEVHERLADWIAQQAYDVTQGKM